MRKKLLWAAAVLAAAGAVVAGIAGAYSYGLNYDLHRGFATPAQLPHAGRGKLLTVRFYSVALHRRADYLVYLPPGYGGGRRYPVYYLLHGMPGDPQHFLSISSMDIRLDNQVSLHRARPMILVYPDGEMGGSPFSDSEWANTPSGAYESYVIDVMHDVDHRFATKPHRQDRVIAGCSAGAYGAVNIALHHLNDFGSVQSWSGYFIETKTGVFAHASRASLAYNSPLDYIRHLGPTLTTDPIRAYIFVGRHDPAYSQQQPMVDLLRHYGAHVQYRAYRGGHDWSVWIPHLNQMLDLASYDMTHARSSHPMDAQLHRSSRLAPLTGLPSSTSAHGALAVARHRPHPSELVLLGALLLALVSAALINLGFVLQHRGHSHRGASLVSVARDRSWLVGQGVGWLGFLGQIAAIALAPLTLVLAFSAGSLAISVPVVARLFGHRVGRTQLAAIAVIAICLASLPIGFAAGHGHLYPGALIGGILAAILVATVLAPGAGALCLAVVAGLLYGAGDAAIKAVAVGLHDRHPAGSTVGWAILVALCTFAGFLSFQTALRRGDAVRPLTLMNAFSAITAATLGVAAFGESLGTVPAATVLHALAIALVLISVGPLAAAQQRLVDQDTAPEKPSEPPHSRSSLGLAHRSIGVARGAGTLMLAAVAVLAASVVTIGLVYGLRGLGWFAGGPRVKDALPLLQLAGFDAQPLGRVLVAGLLAGVALGEVLIRLRWQMISLTGVLAVALLLFESDASYALAHNLRLGSVLASRLPAAGPWVEGLLLIAGCLAAKALAVRASQREPAARWLASRYRPRFHRAQNDL